MAVIANGFAWHPQEGRRDLDALRQSGTTMTAGRTRDRRANSSASSSGHGGPDRRVDAPVDLEGQGLDASRSITGRASAAGPSRSRPRRRSRAAGRTRWAWPPAAAASISAPQRRPRSSTPITSARASAPVDHHGPGAAELHDRPLDRGSWRDCRTGSSSGASSITQANRLKRWRRRSFGPETAEPGSQASGLFSPYHRALPIPNSIDAMAAMPDQRACLQRSLGSTA